jgi:tetratricopeptide (TPR) repeat protein
VLVSLALAGCGGKAKEEMHPASEHELLDRSAQRAFLQGKYAQAASLYEATLGQARIEDRPAAIIDARFNLALSLTYVGNYPAALEQVAQADAERVRRKLPPDGELELLRATIHYRTGDAGAAQRILDPLLGDPAQSPAIAAKAHFLAGLMAADREDAEALRRHRSALQAGESRDRQADQLELDGRLAAIEGDVDAALRLLDEAMRLRGLDRDFRGLTRAQLVAGDVASRAGRTEAAAVYLLRAGRSGAERDEPEARAWLVRARELGERSGDAALVREVDAMLSKVGKDESAD